MASPSERSIFLDAIEISDPVEMKSFMDRACGENVTLRRNVEELVSAHYKSEGVLDRSPVAKHLAQLDETTGPSGELHSGSAPNVKQGSIGSYRLMEQIGEGGFGVVYVAQQDKPVKRKVALKMVKPGMGSKEVIARFEAERQALAMMDHPGIARVFDAGVTEDGRPYFVMELVQGVSITEFCDRYQLGIRERLELFQDVCSAVHHAHQKGIIHRDLKPSNVLTTLYDDKRVVKVIDFGIAKAIGQNLTDKTVYTRFMAMMGTPLYMSPEQAELNGLDVDTRSDIYSLGVLLYELLTGTTPIERSRIDTAGIHEIRKMIVEEEAPRPSYRVSTLGNRLTTVASTRQVESKKLTTIIRGDLDWVVMKAIEKDRKRRYDSAAAMARDVACFLRSEPIEARPPSSIYWLTKFSKRNRVAILTATLVGCSLIAGTGASVYQMTRAMNALEEKDEALKEAIAARAEATKAKQQIEHFSQRLVDANLILSSARTNLEENEVATALDDFQRAIDLQPSYYLPWLQRGEVFARMQLWTEAAADYEQALKIGAPTDQPQWAGVGSLFLLAENEAASAELSQQLGKRLKVESNTIDWQALRNCMVASNTGESFDWKGLMLAARNGMENEDRGPPGMPPTDGSRIRQGGGDFRGRKSEDRRFGGEPPNGFESHGRDGGNRRGPRPGFGGERGGMMPFGAKKYIAAVLAIRAGEIVQALQDLEEAKRDEGWPGNELILAPLAYAKFKTGEVEEAKKILAQAETAIIDMLQTKSADPRESRRPMPWYDKVEAIVLFREFSQAIERREDPWRDRLNAVQENARRDIGL